MILSVVLNYLLFFLLSFSIFEFSFSYYYSFLNPHNQQFAQQAQSFINGRMDIPKGVDTIDIGDKHYWHQGPFPAIILIPFQLIFGPKFNQITMQPLVFIFLCSILYKLARLKKFNRESSIYLVTVFLLGTFMVGLISTPASWFYAQVIAVTLLAGFLLEFETKRRLLVLGILEALLIATRPSAACIGLLIPYLLLKEVYKKKLSLKKFFRKLFIFTIPILICLSLLMFFNYARVGKIFINTYALATLEPLLSKSRDLGIFSLQHIPSNIYYYFLASAQPVTKDLNLEFPYITYHPAGVSLFLICPFFIYSLKTLRVKTKFTREYWGIIFLTLSLLLTFFAMGGYQTFGPRLAADFWPILYLLLLIGLKPPVLTSFQKGIIILSSIFNLYLLHTGFVN